MQTSVESEAAATNDPADPELAGDGGALAFEHDEGARAREEIMLLFVGFGTGLTIGLVFLSYIVLDKLNVLP